MSLIPARWRRPTPPLAALEVESGHEVQRAAERLSAPRGPVVWICATPAGPLDCTHDNEQQAEAHGKTVWWPVTIDGERST